MKIMDAKEYVENTFYSLSDAAHSVWFDAGTPADRVAEYLEEYAERTDNVRLTNSLEVAQHLLAKSANPLVLQQEWSRYNRNGGDPRFLRQLIIEPFAYAEILDHKGKVYGVRFPQSCLVATAWDEPDLYEGREARSMWQKYARHIEVLARIGGEIVRYTWPGGYPVIYWHQVHESSEIFPLCAGCTREHLLEYGILWDVESGDLYDHDLPCDQCGQQLAAYYEGGD